MNGQGELNALSQQQQQQICSILRLGCGRATAAKRVGCTLADVHAAAMNDPKFAADLGLAESDHELTHMKNVFAAAQEPKNWRASVWALERTYPDRYLRSSPSAVSLDQLKEIAHAMANVVAEEVDDPQRCRRIADRLAGIVDNLRGTTTHQINHDEDDQSIDEQD